MMCKKKFKHTDGISVIDIGMLDTDFLLVTFLNDRSTIVVHNHPHMM